MPPVPQHAFAERFRALPAATRRQFVADLYDARGWSTRVEDGVVVAERSGDVAYDGETPDGAETERIGVVDPGRFGTPDVDGLDALVSARDREGVREACEAAGVDYLGPDDLRDRLLYGLDRDVAADLFAEHFDESLAGKWAPPSDGSDAAGALPAWATSTRGVALGLLVVLVGAAVAGPGLGPTLGGNAAPEFRGTYTPEDTGAVGGTVTVTPTPTESGGEAGPPGVGPRGLVDASALAQAHARAVTNRSYELVASGTGPANWTVLGRYPPWNYTLRAENASHFRYDSHYQPPPGSDAAGERRTQLYAVSGTTYLRQTDGENVSYRRFATSAIDGLDEVTGWGRTDVRRYLDTDESQVSCYSSTGFEECVLYNLTVTGEPARLPDAVADYRAVALVDPQGMVRSLTVTYTVPDADGDGERERVRLELTYRGVDVTAVAAPEWVAELRANGTATETN